MIQHMAEFGFAVMVVTAALVLALRLVRPRRPKPIAALPDSGMEPMVFLFQGDQLLDATEPALRLLERLRSQDLTGLLIWLEQNLPGASEALRTAAADGRGEVLGKTGHGSARMRLVIEDLGEDTLRFTLVDPESPQAGILVDALSQNALEAEVAILRHAMNGAPVLVWRQGVDGVITWANEAYIAAVETCSETAESGLWPLPALFRITASDVGTEARIERHEIAGPDGSQWYDCHIRPLGDELISFALPADAAVRAERSLREFVQTLSKTFADLPIGLAIFDRARNLQLFNPALIDLTGLSASMLIGRPSLYAFLDQLREERMIPEPKDYRSWRRQIATLESAAAAGHHVETWSLPGGQTYRVTGRPHPDGAIALLFEDITTEVTLTRRFRADILLGVNALDALGDAVAIFDGNGKPVLVNALWRHVWDDKTGLADFPALVQSQLDDTAPGFNSFADHLSGNQVRRIVTGCIAPESGHMLYWRTAPMPAGRVLIRFSGEGLEDAVSKIGSAAPMALEGATETAEPAKRYADGMKS